MLTRTFLAVILTATLVVANAQTAPQSTLTLEWIFSDEGRRVASLPSNQWLADGKLMLYDGRLPAAQRAFEIIDPETGARRTALDMKVAVASLNTLLPGSPITNVLSWPQSFDPSGRRALYIFNGDLFVLDLAKARFTRLTKTDEKEQSAEFSPDSNKLAFVRKNDLYTIDLKTLSETRLTRDGAETTLNGTLSWLYWEEIFGRRDIGYWWSPDSKALAYLQTDESSVPVSTFVDFQPDTPRVITQRYPKAGMPNPRVRAGVVETSGKPTTWISITDRPFDYTLRVKWLPDGRRLSVQTLTRDQHELGLYLAGRETGAAKRILTDTNSGWINIHDDLYFLNDGQHFLWASERDDYYHLYRYSMDGRLFNQVTKGPWSLSSSGGVPWVRRAVTGIDESNGWIYFTSMERAPIERHFYRIKFDGSGMTRLSQDPGVHRISMSPNAQFYLDTFSDLHTLPSLTLRRSDGAEQLSLAKPRMELLADFDMQYPELITIPAKDGFKMPARVLKPKGFRSDHRYPVILNIYGGASSPSVANAWQGPVLFDQLLAREGYIVIKVDNRAATAISKRLENGVINKIGEVETEDFVDATNWLKAQTWVDPNRVGVWGWSHGGWSTLNLLTRS
ncbi:MAG TPA: DPP IV N-terminal domain-containing protein, partial [Pyrinomonadaceae bacterium]|nr:DPP IV N-terminal domain-containing protein [Pyrinomonadaceae bacterium]